MVSGSRFIVPYETLGASSWTPLCPEETEKTKNLFEAKSLGLKGSICFEFRNKVKNKRNKESLQTEQTALEVQTTSEQLSRSR